MFRFRQRVMDLPRGTATAVFLADRSNSLSYDTFRAIDRVIPQFRAALPGLRVFSFHWDYVEVGPGLDAETVERSYPRCHPDEDKPGFWNRTHLGENTTTLGYMLDAVIRLKPGKTVIFSDGGAVDQGRALRAADRITGEIDCYFCPSRLEGYDDVPFLEKLARRGRGRLVRFDQGADLTTELRRSLQLPQPQQFGVPMSNPYNVRGGRVNISAPPRQSHVIIEEIDVWKQRVINIRHRPDQYVEHDQPADIDITMAPSQVNVQHAQQPIIQKHEAPRGMFAGFLDALIGAPSHQPAQNELDRGTVRSVEEPRRQAPALPASQSQQMPVPAARALPAPGRALPRPGSQPQPLPIAHQPEAEMEIEAPRNTWANALFGRRG